MRLVRRILAVAVLLEAVVLVTYGVYMGVETIFSSAADGLASAVMAVSIIATGGMLVLAARAADRGRPGVRSPIIVWQLMQLSVAYLTLGTSWLALGIAFVILAVVAVGTALWPGVFEQDVPDF